MKKYLIIAGVPRAGKSTISKRIAKEKGYQHISMDSILAGIEKVFPETKVHTDSLEVYFVITPDISPEERFRILKQHDTPDDYTYFHSDEENRKDCKDIVEISNWLKKQCIECNLPFVDTTYNRENVIDEFMDRLG